MDDLRIRSFEYTDLEWKRYTLNEYLGSTTLVRKGNLVDVADHEGFIALLGNHPSGLATYWVEGRILHISFLVSFIPNKGIGSGLLQSVKQKAKELNCKKISVVVTNDNLSALKFYQKNEFHLTALYPLAVEEARKIKPEIPLTGLENIPLRDELELEFSFT